MSDDNEEHDDDNFESGSSLPAFVLPFVTAGAALFVGALFGGLFIWLVKPAEEKIREVPRDLTQAELEEVCAPFVIEKEDEVKSVTAKMVTLATDLKAKKDRVAELEAELKKGGGGNGGTGAGSSALRAELEKAKKAMDEMRTELEADKAERDQLIVDLRKTIVQLEEAEQRAEFEAEQKEAYKADALINKWKAFKSSSTVEICDHGGRKKMGKCREKVADLMTDGMWGDFKHCVLAGQATPSMLLIDKKASPPQFARYLDQEDKITKDWAVVMCDPTLPEADLEHEDVAVSEKAPI